MKRSWALILGASSGLGRACASALAAHGNNILGVHLDPTEKQPEIDAFVDELRAMDVDAHFFNENAANDSARQRVLTACAQQLTAGQQIRVVVHSLAFGALLPFIPRETPTARGSAVLSHRQLNMTMSVMAHSLVYWTQDLVRAELLGKGSSIFALTSAGSTRVSLNYGAVSAAKCALESHVRQLAFELAPLGIAVNAVRSGVALTPALKRIPEHQEIVDRALSSNPHGRLTRPEDIGKGIAALAAIGSSWMTGNVIGLDGGEALTT